MDDLVEQIGKLSFSFRVNDRAEVNENVDDSDGEFDVCQVFQANITEDFNQTFVQKMLNGTKCVTPDNVDEVKIVESLDVFVFRSGCFRLCSRGGSFREDCSKLQHESIQALKSTEILLFISVSENLTEKDRETSFKVFSFDSDGNAKDVGKI